ncbi:helix-turn-helix domain-containing protein [Saccharothrix sp. ST-888]|uniref:helix-turn-helix domain-containing protein n=1 Tax=Saccharothrix sp. ST-888 TaxID=1427391 RepID=UPI0009E34867
MTQLINASEHTWVELLTGLDEAEFEDLLETLRLRARADGPRAGRRWTLSLEDRVLLVSAYWRTHLTMREVATLFGISKSAADRIVGHLGPHLELSPLRRRRCRLSLRCEAGSGSTGSADDECGDGCEDENSPVIPAHHH